MAGALTSAVCCFSALSSSELTVVTIALASALLTGGATAASCCGAVSETSGYAAGGGRPASYPNKLFSNVLLLFRASCCWLAEFIVPLSIAFVASSIAALVSVASPIKLVKILL